MSTLKDYVKNVPAYERKIDLRTYPLGEDQVVVEGWLEDNRLFEGYYWDGRPRPSGVFHWMCVRLLIGDWPLKILDAEAEMPTIPHELCRENIETVKKIIGMPIVSGYSEEVRQRLGGVNGCSHLTYLLIAMGPAAVQGYWAHKSTQPVSLPASMEEFSALSYLINSCSLWRADGPLVQKLRESLGKNKKIE